MGLNAYRLRHSFVRTDVPGRFVSPCLGEIGKSVRAAEEIAKRYKEAKQQEKTQGVNGETA